jgi:hypothetical protein
MMNALRHGCDYCSDSCSQPGDSLHVIKLSRKRNGESVQAEICQRCLTDIALYLVKPMREVEDELRSFNRTLFGTAWNNASPLVREAGT